jgi:hypothetical protein
MWGNALQGLAVLDNHFHGSARIERVISPPKPRGLGGHRATRLQPKTKECIAQRYAKVR